MACIAVVTTVGSVEEARRIGRALVERRLAACAQITPIESFYVWDDALCNDTEFRLLLKTTDARYAALASASDRPVRPVSAVISREGTAPSAQAVSGLLREAKTVLVAGDAGAEPIEAWRAFSGDNFDAQALGRIADQCQVRARRPGSVRPHTARRRRSRPAAPRARRDRSWRRAAAPRRTRRAAPRPATSVTTGWGTVREARCAAVSFTASSSRQRNAPESPPSLRVATRKRVCCVAPLGKG